MTWQARSDRAARAGWAGGWGGGAGMKYLASEGEDAAQDGPGGGGSWVGVGLRGRPGQPAI